MYFTLQKPVTEDHITCIYMFSRFFFMYNSICFSHQDIGRKDDWLGCFKIIKLPGFPWPPLFNLKSSTLAEAQMKDSNFSIKIHENHLFRPISAVLIETRPVGKQLGAFSSTELQSHTHSCTFKAVNLTNHDDDDDGGQGKEQ